MPPPPSLELTGLSPYWMDRATCALNPVRLRGIYLLTAPNMSGKSTLMRSVLVAALLANCGLCVPCDAAVVPRYVAYVVSCGALFSCNFANIAMPSTALVT